MHNDPNLTLPDSLLSGLAEGDTVPQRTGIRGFMQRRGGAALAIGGMLAPMAADRIFGTAERPGMAGRGGAMAGSVLGGALGGAGVGAMAGPWGALIGAVTGATVSLLNFNQQVEDLKVVEISDKFNKALLKIDGKGGGDKGDGSNTSVAEENIRRSRLELKGMTKYNKQYTNEYQKEFNQSAVEPLLISGLEQFKKVAIASPDKSFEQLKKDMPELTKFIQEFGYVNKEATEATKAQIESSRKVYKAQMAVDMSFAKLAISAEEMSYAIEHTGDLLDKAFARNDVGRGGISGGTDSMTIASMGPNGKNLQDFTKYGGGIDQAKMQIKEALLEATNNGSLGTGDSDGFVQTFVDKLQGPLFEGMAGSFLKNSAVNTLQGESGQAIYNKMDTDPAGALEMITRDFDKLRPIVEKTNNAIAKAMQGFAQNAVKIEEGFNKYLETVSDTNKLANAGNREQAETYMANNQEHYIRRDGTVISPQDQMQQVNARLSKEAFQDEQYRFHGVTAENHNSPTALLRDLASQQGNLEQLKGAAYNQSQNGGTQDFSLQIAETTNTIDGLKNALKNLSSSTTVLESAQDKLKDALDRQAADLGGRKAVGEEMAFGSRKDRIKTMRTENLIGRVAQQGHLENLSDTQRSDVYSRLKETSGIVRNIGGMKLTGQNMIDAISSQYTPQTQMDQRLINNTPNGRRMVNEEVYQAEQGVFNVRENMLNAGRGLADVQEADHGQQTAEHAQLFNAAIASMQRKMEEEVANAALAANQIAQANQQTTANSQSFNAAIMSMTQVIQGAIASLKGAVPVVPAKPMSQGGVVYAARGKMVPRGTDTVPAMLTPGETVVNKKSSDEYGGLLSWINDPNRKRAPVDYDMAEQHHLSNVDVAENGKRQDGFGGKDYLANKAKVARLLRDRDERAESSARQTKRDQLLGPQQFDSKLTSQANVGANMQVGMMNTERQNLLRQGDIQGADAMMRKQVSTISQGTGSYNLDNRSAREKNAPANQDAINAQGFEERKREIAKRQQARARRGAPEYVPVDKRQAPEMTNAFNDVGANTMYHEQMQKKANTRNMNFALQSNGRGRGQTDGSQQVENAARYSGQGQGQGGLAEGAKPLTEALNNFPRTLELKSTSNVNVVLNGADVINKMKGDLENEVWGKILQTIKDEVAKVVKTVPA